MAPNFQNVLKMYGEKYAEICLLLRVSRPLNIQTIVVIILAKNSFSKVYCYRKVFSWKQKSTRLILTPWLGILNLENVSAQAFPGSSPVWGWRPI